MEEQVFPLPTLFILGAQRAGTGSLCHYLGQHPAIHFSEPRDPAYFQKNELYNLGVGYYKRAFRGNGASHTWFGEATSSYFGDPHTVCPRLCDQMNDEPLRFVILLREPVSRAWSHYLSRVHHGFEKRTFAEALTEEVNNPATSETHYFAEGLYAHLLTQWQKYFPRESFLVLLSEDLAANPAAQANRVFTWLGVEPEMPIDFSERFNSASYSRSPQMIDFLNHPPDWMARISKQLWPDAWQRSRIRHHLRARFHAAYSALPPIDPELSKELRHRYRNDILALSKMLGRYLSHWLDKEKKVEMTAIQVA